MKTNHQIQKRQIGAIAIAMITGTGLILGILLSLLCYQLGMYKDQSKKEILNNKYDLLTKYYEATIMSEINKKKDEDAVVNQKKITNFKYSVFGVWNTEIDAQPSSAHLYHTTFTDTKATRSVPDPNLATILQNNITTDYDGTDVDLYRKTLYNDRPDSMHYQWTVVLSNQITILFSGQDRRNSNRLRCG